jgi:uncharacterized protein (DUF934 family)
VAEALPPDLDSLAPIAVNFPKFTDGRGYSTAALLRTRYGYTGESAPSATCCATSFSSWQRCRLRHLPALKAGKYMPSSKRRCQPEGFQDALSGRRRPAQPLFRRRSAA